MIKIRYSASEGLDISGDIETLQALRHHILTLIETEGPDLTVEANTAFDPVPYKETLPKLVIGRGQGLARVEITSNREVRISGSAEKLKGFASCLNFPVWTTLWTHTHIEYFEGHPFLTPDSVPMVVSLE